MTPKSGSRWRGYAQVDAVVERWREGRSPIVWTERRDHLVFPDRQLAEAPNRVILRGGKSENACRMGRLHRGLWPRAGVIPRLLAKSPSVKTGVRGWSGIFLFDLTFGAHTGRVLPLTCAERQVLAHLSLISVRVQRRRKHVDLFLPPQVSAHGPSRDAHPS